jgi:hypothetical protein
MTVGTCFLSVCEHFQILKVATATLSGLGDCDPSSLSYLEQKMSKLSISHLEAVVFIIWKRAVIGSPGKGVAKALVS